MKAQCTRWDPSAAQQNNVLLVEFLSSAQLFQSSDLWNSPHFFFLQGGFTCFLHSAFLVPLQPVLHHLPFTTGCPLIQSSANSYSGTWQVWNNGGHLPLHRQRIGLLLFSLGSPMGTVLRNLLKVDSVVADLKCEKCEKLGLLDDLLAESKSSHWWMNRLKLVTKKSQQTQIL